MAEAAGDKQPLELNPHDEEQKKVMDQLTGNTDNIFQVNTAPLKAWPALVGLSGEEARDKILADNPNLNVQILPDDSFVTMDFRTDRVRIFIDANGKVSRAPTLG